MIYCFLVGGEEIGKGKRKEEGERWEREREKGKGWRGRWMAGLMV